MSVQARNAAAQCEFDSSLQLSEIPYHKRSSCRSSMLFCRRAHDWLSKKGIGCLTIDDPPSPQGMQHILPKDAQKHSKG
ncbi:hypothetical protein Ddc_08231 [Ditylenchus destructor]|nr:hypothetical protein Ddc_08231 [Ditylenchus destructor]